MAGEKQSKTPGDVGGKQAEAASGPGASAPATQSPAVATPVAAQAPAASPVADNSGSVAKVTPENSVVAPDPATSPAGMSRSTPPIISPINEVGPISPDEFADVDALYGLTTGAVSAPLPSMPVSSNSSGGAVAVTPTGPATNPPTPGTPIASTAVPAAAPGVVPISSRSRADSRYSRGLDDLEDLLADLNLSKPPSAASSVSSSQPVASSPAAGGAPSAPVSANNSGGSAAVEAPSGPGANPPTPGTPIASTAVPAAAPGVVPISSRSRADARYSRGYDPDELDDLLADLNSSKPPSAASSVSSPQRAASSPAVGGAPSSPVSANKSYSDRLDEVLNNATSTSAKPLAAAVAPSAAAVPLGGSPSRLPPAVVASATAASGQAPGQLGGTPLRNPERSGSPPPARPVALGGRDREWVSASRSGGSAPGSPPDRVPVAPNAGPVPLQGMRAVPWQAGRPAAETPTGSAATATPTPEIAQLMGEMRKLDREAEALRKITTKWEESVKAELQNKGINREKCATDRVELFDELLKFKGGTPPAENTSIEAIVKRRDEAVLRGAPPNEIAGITKELTTNMGRNENDPDIIENLENRDEILQKIKQANDIESAYKMKLPGNGLLAPDGTRKDEFNKADIAIYQARLQEIALNMAALRQQISSAQDTPRASAPEPNDALENPNPGDPRKKIEDVVKLIAQDPNVNNCKKVSEGEYQLDFKTVPPAPINVSKNKVTAPKGADETTMRKQCQVFFDLMDKTGRKDFSLDDVKVSGADEKKLKALLAEEFANRYGTSISLNARDPSTPAPPIEPTPSVSASIGGPRGGMGGHRG